MPLKSVNLNLIPVLRELLRHRSVSAAGHALGRSPSAVSEGLSQLRAIFDDPLLVRAGGRMILTARAAGLVEPLEAACAQLEMLVRPDHFLASATERLFVIAAPDYYAFTIGPVLLKAFREAAPGFTFRFVDLDRNLTEKLASRAVDFALMPDFLLGDVTPSRLQHHVLTEDITVVLMRAGHELAADGSISTAQLKRFSHVAYHPSWESLERQSVPLNYRRQFKVVARTAQVTLLPFFLSGTDYVALVPERLADGFDKTLALAHRRLTVPEPCVKTMLTWSPAQDADPAHRWFRMHLILSVGTEIAALTQN